MRLYGQVSRAGTTTGAVDIPLKARPTGRSVVTDMARAGSRRTPTVPVPTGPPPAAPKTTRKTPRRKPPAGPRRAAECGTLSKYSSPNNCRCRPCKDAKKAYDAKRREIERQRWAEAGVAPALVRAWAATAEVPCRKDKRPALSVLDAYLRERAAWQRGEA